MGLKYGSQKMVTFRKNKTFSGKNKTFPFGGQEKKTLPLGWQDKIRPFLLGDRKKKTLPLGGQEKIRPFLEKIRYFLEKKDLFWKKEDLLRSRQRVNHIFILHSVRVHKNDEPASRSWEGPSLPLLAGLYQSSHQVKLMVILSIITYRHPIRWNSWSFHQI